MIKIIKNRFRVIWLLWRAHTIRPVRSMVDFSHYQGWGNNLHITEQYSKRLVGLTMWTPSRVVVGGTVRWLTESGKIAVARILSAESAPRVYDMWWVEVYLLWTENSE